MVGGYKMIDFHDLQHYMVVNGGNMISLHAQPLVGALNDGKRKIHSFLPNPPFGGGGKENLLTLPTTTLHGGHFHENTKFVKSTRVHTYTYIYIYYITHSI